MAEECGMAQALMEGWNDFSLSTERFRQITEDFAAAMEDGLNNKPSPLQMLPSYIGKPDGRETGVFMALDFGGTNVRVAEVQLYGNGKTVIKRMNKVSLRNEAAGYDYTGADTHVRDLFSFIARQVAVIADGDERKLGHSFSYASRQIAIGRAEFLGWSKEIKVAGVERQDINKLLDEELIKQNIRTVHPVAVLNDTTATLLAAAYECQETDLGSVCGTGHNTCYYEAQPRHGDSSGVMGYNAESGGFDRLPFTRFDDLVDVDSEYPGKQRLEKMVAGRYLGELTRRILWSGRGKCGMQFLEECTELQQVDGISSVDLAVFTGDGTAELDRIGAWFSKKMPGKSVNLAERYFIKAVAELVVGRAATLIAASYAGFLLRLDPQRQHRHVIGINGSLYEKMPGFAAGIQTALGTYGGWSADRLSFAVVNEAPLVGAAIAAAMTGMEAR